jgi:O-succinylbenzoate synthase
MTLNQIGIYSFQLPLYHTLNVKGQQLTTREGIILRLRDSHNRISYGEISPLPGLHEETLDACVKQLAHIQSELTGAYIPKPSGIFGFLDTILPRKNWLPSVRFGLETALMALYLQNELNHDQPAFLAIQQQRIKINLLVTGEHGEIIRMVKRGLNEGYRAIKIKAGAGKLQEEIDLVRMIRRLSGPDISLRVDANRCWHLAEALSFIRALHDCPLEYIEEPLQDPGQLPLLFEKTHIPIAIDETLVQYRPEKLKLAEWMNTFVVKPAAIGSLTDTLAYIHLAESNKRKIVISDNYQTGIGLTFLVRLAASLKKAIPMGFNTYNYLREDLLMDRIQVSGGEIFVQDALERSKKVNLSCLQEFSDSLALNESDDQRNKTTGNLRSGG